jgi:hypothetical protein
MYVRTTTEEIESSIVYLMHIILKNNIQKCLKYFREKNFLLYVLKKIQKKYYILYQQYLSMDEIDILNIIS